ncbi:MAG: hypothetical protein AAFV93_03395, partial [Chloroflexota bacterium]
LKLSERNKKYVSQPTKFVKYRDANSLLLTWQLQRKPLITIALFLFLIAFAGFVDIFTTIPSIIGIIVSPILLYILLKSKPTTKLSVDANNLTSKKISIARKSIEQLFVTRDTQVKGTGRKRVVIYHYYLNALTSKQSDVIKLARFTKLSDALYAEQEIEIFLGIRDVPTANEYTGN